MPTFRVHFDDGGKMDVDAHTPDQARGIAKDRRPGRVVKVKQLKEVVSNGNE